MNMVDDYTDTWEDDDAFEADDSFDDLDDELLDSVLGDEDDDAEFLPFLPFPSPFGRGRKPSPRPPARRVPTAAGRGYYQQPPAKQFVTQAQLKSALVRVQQDVKRNAAGVKTLTGQMAATTTQLGRQAALNRSQTARIAKLGSRMDQQVQTSLLMSLLEDDKADYEVKTVTLPQGASQGTRDAAQDLVGTKVELEKESDPFTKLLPILLSGGLGGSDAGKGGGMFGDPMTAMALVLALK